MGRLNNLSGKEAAKAFGTAGWQVMGQVGSHLVMTKPGERANLSIPQHGELSVGTLRSLIRSANMSVDEFLKLL
ncbi:MAG TPA: type II toxin-antitoxin system HicA family toxin [Acidobacteriaceae bacterium]|nr:type II toxin-antitoxin system HicA family toxin [Acidobacteriaceae bacterium]